MANPSGIQLAPAKHPSAHERPTQARPPLQILPISELTAGICGFLLYAFLREAKWFVARIPELESSTKATGWAVMGVGRWIVLFAALAGIALALRGVARSKPGTTVRATVAGKLDAVLDTRAKGNKVWARIEAVVGATRALAASISTQLAPTVAALAIFGAGAIIYSAVEPSTPERLAAVGATIRPTVNLFIGFLVAVALAAAGIASTLKDRGQGGEQ